MRKTCVWLAMVFLVFVTAVSQAHDSDQQELPLSSVQIELPSGDIEIAYVESNEGMVLVAQVSGISVRSQRLYLGDGKIAVKYEASNNGFFAPSGKVKSAVLEIKKGDSVVVPSAKIEKWGAVHGAVYILVRGIKFVTIDQ